MAIKRTSGKMDTPIRLLLYGEEKIGKSQFACDIPDAAHLDLEQGTFHLDVNDRWQIGSWEEFGAAIDFLADEKHNFKSVVIDTVDKLEEYLWEQVGTDNGEQNIESFGYSKGYKIAAQELRRLWVRIERMRNKRGLNVIVIGHCQVVRFKNPVGDDYDTFTPKCHRDLIGFVKDQCDAIGFVNMESVLQASTQKKGKGKPVYTGARVLHLHKQAGFDAGCRYPVPPTVGFSWEDFCAAYRGGEQVKPEQLAEQIETALAQLENDGDYCAKVRGSVAKHETDMLWLSRCLDKVNTKIMETQNA